jgi:HK97 family phage major capsid protein
MLSELKAIYEKKRDAYARWRDVLDSAEKEGRALTAEDNAICNECEKVIDECNAQIKGLEAREEQRQRLAEVGAELAAAKQAPAPTLQREPEAPKPDRRTIGEKLKALLEDGMTRSEAIDHLAKQRDEQQSAAFRAYLLGSHAALRQNSDADGGFLVAPEQFIARLIKDLDNMVWFRNFATVIPVVGAQGIGVPTLETDMSDTAWTTELAVGTEDSSMVFGKRSLTPHPLAKYIKVSKDLLRSAALSVEAIVRERMAYKFGTVQETAFMTGHGAGQPLGVFTASDNGITTARDVSTDNTSTAITADGLINCKYGLSSPWLSSANLRWVFHRDAVKMIRKLKDGEGQYLWVPGLTRAVDDVILNVPVLVSEYAPNTFTTLQYVGLIGDLSYYWIAENMSMEIQRLVELGALTNQDYFIGRMALDGMPVLEEAFIRVKLG